MACILPYPVDTFDNTNVLPWRQKLSLELKRVSDLPTDKQPYLNFMQKLKDSPMKTAFLNAEIRDRSTKAQISCPDLGCNNDLKEYIKTNSDFDCITKANDICEMTNPYLYISEDTVRFPPRWNIKTYVKAGVPKNTNLKCFNSIYNCCKSIKK
jgi:hypothetical protein